jgi:uncharacterized membrane protein YcjF (UPF0283 family)
MKKISASVWMVLFTLMISLSSCELVKGIFKAGVWVGVLTVVAVIALVVFIISRLTDKK